MPDADQTKLNDAQVKSLRCAFLDLIGAQQAQQQGDLNAHDWKAHSLTINELAAAFADVLADLIPEEE